MERITFSVRLQEHIFKEIWKKQKMFISPETPFLCLRMFIHLFLTCLYFINFLKLNPMFCLFCFVLKKMKKKK